MNKNSRVLHARFALLGTVVQVASSDGHVLVKWDNDLGEAWYAPTEVIDVTGEGV